jgi:hypothetical protein
MRKTLLFLPLLILCLTAAGDDPKTSAIDWTPVHGYTLSESEVFLDRSSQKVVDPEGDFRSTTLLLVSKTPQSVKIEGKKVIIKSMVRLVVAGCQSDVASYMTDMYFDVKKPGNGTKPVYIRNYGPTPDNLFRMDKNSALRSALCPNYI